MIIMFLLKKLNENDYLTIEYRKIIFISNTKKHFNH